MGCDIHMVVEVKYNSGRGQDEWVGIHACPYAEVTLLNEKGEKAFTATGNAHWPIRQRNYNLFAALAGVRGDGPDAKGMPDDASALARMESEGWGEDGHSHSYCSADEFIKLASEHHTLPDIVRKTIEDGAGALEQHLRKYLGVSESVPLEDVRVVFWFDN